MWWTTVNFLNVFSVILCLHTSVSLHIPNKGHNVLHDQLRRNINYQSNNPVDKGFSSQTGSTRQSWQSQNEIAQRIKNSPTLSSQNKGLEAKSQNSDLVYQPERTKDNILIELQNPPDTVPVEAVIQNENVLSIYKKSKFLNPKEKPINNNYLNSPIIKQSQLNPEKETGSLISTSPEESPFREQQVPSTTTLNLDEDNFDSFRHLISKAKDLHSLHSSENKLKRYMIVHHDGTVEHLDNLEPVVTKNPNIIGVKSSDLEKFTKTKTNVLPTTESQSNIPAQDNVTKLLPINVSNPAPPLVQQKETLENITGTEIIPLPSSPSGIIPKQELTRKEPQSNSEMILLPSNPTEIMQKQDLTRNEPMHTYLPVESLVDKLDSEKDSEGDEANSIKITPKWIPLKYTKDEKDNIQDTTSSPDIPEQIDFFGNWFKKIEFWDMIKSDARNVFYLLFLPPKPPLQKETKVTIFPNGTRIEEVTEIVEEEDSIPRATKTTTIIHGAEKTCT